jgi:hypothetical protein
MMHSYRRATQCVKVLTNIGLFFYHNIVYFDLYPIKIRHILFCLVIKHILIIDVMKIATPKLKSM